MSIYTPKIVISQFTNTEKVRFENANGEMQMLIESSAAIRNANPEDSLSHPSQPDIQE